MRKVLIALIALTGCSTPPTNPSTENPDGSSPPPTPPSQDSGAIDSGAIDGGAADAGRDSAHGDGAVPPPLMGTDLGKLAAMMAPDSWGQLLVPGQDAILGVGSHTGSMLPYCNTMPWNPMSKVIEIIGQDHGYPALRHVRFDVAKNQFILVADNAGLGSGHGFDHNTLNPYTGDLYDRLYSGFTGHISSMVKPFGASSFVSLPDVPAADQVAIGTCWWSGAFDGAGSQGAFVIFNSGNATGTAQDGEMLAYDPLTSTWFLNQQGVSPNYGSGATYGSVMEYSHVKNVAVYGGGDVAPTSLWRMSSDHSVMTMPSPPPGTEVGIQRALLVDDPVSGNFLLLSAGQLWELDPSGAGTWNQLASPPPGVGIPGPNTIDSMIASSISDYGVVAFITQKEQVGGTFFLYKHP